MMMMMMMCAYVFVYSALCKPLFMNLFYFFFFFFSSIVHMTHNLFESYCNTIEMHTDYTQQLIWMYFSTWAWAVCTSSFFLYVSQNIFISMYMHNTDFSFKLQVDTITYFPIDYKKRIERDTQYIYECENNKEKKTHAISAEKYQKTFFSLFLFVHNKAHNSCVFQFNHVVDVPLL